MAEPDQISRKRMRMSSSFAQNPTISKTQNQIQSNRSGQTLSAASRAGNRLSGEKLERKAPPRMYPRVTIKDLRLRRVFTPASISSDWEFNGKGETPNQEQTKESLHDSRNLKVVQEGINKANVDRPGDSMEDREASEIMQTTPPDSEQFSSETLSRQEIYGSNGNDVSEKKSETNLRTKSVIHPCSRAKIFTNPASFSYRRLLPYLMKAADDATSSDRSSKPDKSHDQAHPCIISSQGRVENGRTRNVSTHDPKEEADKSMTVDGKCGEAEHVSQSTNNVSDKLSDGNSRACSLKKTTESSPNRKSVCSKLKLFIAPGSVNYRRLLPYLRDIPEVTPHTEKNAEENQEAQGMVTPDAPIEQDSSHDTGPQPVEHFSGSAALSGPDNEQETQVKHVIPDTEKHLDSTFKVSGSETLASTLPDSGCSSDVETLAEAKNSDTETRNGAGKLKDEKNAEKPEVNGLNPKESTLQATFVSSGTPPSASPSKGVLKRNLRGCRGLCTCLNCSSFRLHAERAFEFSRNQLQDTEEMVLDLVGEISRLRDMLEKHASANADDAESCTIQVQEACRRASEAEEAAKSRLHQMNDDLQVHCRIPTEGQARVRFAHSNQERDTEGH
ncbi:PREDICTED: uncharacterized protein LOC104804782 isoform X4 [Tarenaya hassleriana]|uniref:uncharacterized protein LOC104804782 isoform X3 n=1 Tax=Tarenaya hassleriana TaxID=28532 RepID=UPI00053C929E|nr:PREDICTED: uncharacterized protein LOC104804782 isoform X3 [Tarenaya hassleriana]XP_010527434.1 PREDICTED: uncharacterized protein LOC104804782 isoform X4 [Tarenaya hassleriana]